jgi:hypothetical protein
MDHEMKSAPLARYSKWYRREHDRPLFNLSHVLVPHRGDPGCCFVLSEEDGKLENILRSFLLTGILPDEDHPR